MSNKTIYVILGILLAITILLFAGGYIYLQKNNVSSPKTETLGDTFPFGQGSAPREIAGAQRTGTINEKRSETVQGGPVSQNLRQIGQQTIAGSAVFNDGNNTIIRYVEKQTGHVYESDAKGNGRRI